jgi:NAD(P)-dependent dehydrogenase (short-subunit alcohol dehydrogenase family)
MILDIQKEATMQIRDSVAFVTGANRGLGAKFLEVLLERGARKVYAAARDPKSIARVRGVVSVRLDVTSADDIAAAAREASDVTLLVNNAGILRYSPLLGADAVTAARAELETNVFGPLALARAFAPHLATNGGGAIINVLSVLSWLTLPQAATYSLSKAAAWSLTNGLRGELAGQGTHVLALHIGFMDTDMARAVTAPKIAPAEVARFALDGLESGAREVLADAVSQQVKSGLSAADAPYLGAP